ncbi:MAG: 6-carboxytetrahydropterin synthase [Pseudomonadota bacterium]
MRCITKSFAFHAAHRLRHPDRTDEENQAVFGVCAFPHGHTYQLQVTLAGTPDDNGMILLFGSLKSIVSEAVLSRYDHADLNALPEYQRVPPTAEVIAGHIFDVLAPLLTTDRYRLHEVRLYETPTAWASVTADA